MSKLTGAQLDRVVARAMGLKSVNNCEQWGEEPMKMKNLINDDDDIQTYVQPLDLNPYRNMVIEEIAQEIEKFTFAFGVDTVASFAAFVRGMKDHV